ncbi:hypothetical protein [Streptococcus pneumoniae]|uniref:hypothetical protein n=1 Tax=Streptococcus pneumoniae TaxID=1313 RepID=UPI0005DC30CD|nr:hypothetical protein [Streptococcus pneumoniae]CEW44100.1 Uncharacterised protein [Streptococcus pneumoniae]CIT40804.1 Uncharacterised protein [Streptococcus pneumoniae]CIU94273.1 Uncharacterised protein [Streptococcus pneumoniae]CIZ91177.1 Uncharacterised protein [Streptococcus pneumoniae]CIZ94294.1 Uncharacterised protein [Streptococcus pneumoniae]
MNELDISNTQAAVLIVILIGLLLYLNHRDRKKSAQIERENQQTIKTPKTIKTPSEDLNPDYGRYIQLAGVNVWGGME